MRRLDLNQKGFTLIEAMISLAITGILTLVTIPSIFRLYDYHQLNQALTVLQSDIHFVRDYDMNRLVSDNFLAAMWIYPQEDRYDIVIGQDKLIYLSRKFPKRVSIAGNSIIIITFNPSGSIISGQTLSVRSKYYSKKLVFSIGTGGFDIRDED